MEWTYFIIAMILWDIIRALGTAWLTARKVKKDREKEQRER